jgi:ricin-type beta-trefoil lectin protein
MRRIFILITGLAVTALALVVPGTANATQFNTWSTFSSRLCMGVQGGDMTPGTAIIAWACDGSLNQLWTADSNSGQTGYFLFRNAADPTECLSVFQMETTNGAPLVIWPCKDQSSNQDQRWAAPLFSTIFPLSNSAAPNLQVVPSGGQGSQLGLWDSRIPYNWVAANFTNM